MKNQRVCGIALCFIILTSVSSLVQAEWDQQAKLTASDGAAGDRFGTVSLEGDFAIVGAHSKDNVCGAAYIYQRSGSSWTEMTELTAFDRAEGDAFGMTVSINGDYAIIGAYRDGDKGTDSGSAYIYHWNGTIWDQMAKLTASDGEAYDYFGGYVSIKGDYAVVGATEFGTSRPGSAYVYHREGSTWVEQDKLTASDGQGGDRFGESVAIDGDNIIVGSICDDSTSGSAYIFQRNVSDWNQVAKLTASDRAAGDSFSAVSISGDYVFVGAPYNDDKGTSSGSAYIFKKPETGWMDMTETQKLLHQNGASGDLFGGGISISGDYAIIASAYDDNEKGVDAGAAHIFHLIGSEWVLEKDLVGLDIVGGNHFGVSVGIDGNYAIVGADLQDSWRGSAYVFTVPEPATLSLLILGGLTMLRRRS